MVSRRVTPNSVRHRFIRQLQAFQACGYNPSPINDAYMAWKRSSKRDVTYFLNILNDTTRIDPYKLYMSRYALPPLLMYFRENLTLH